MSTPDEQNRRGAEQLEHVATLMHRVLDNWPGWEPRQLEDLIEGWLLDPHHDSSDVSPPPSGLAAVLRFRKLAFAHIDERFRTAHFGTQHVLELLRNPEVVGTVRRSHAQLITELRIVLELRNDIDSAGFISRMRGTLAEHFVSKLGEAVGRGAAQVGAFFRRMQHLFEGGGSNEARVEVVRGYAEHALVAVHIDAGLCRTAACMLEPHPHHLDEATIDANAELFLRSALLAVVYRTPMPPTSLGAVEARHRIYQLISVTAPLDLVEQLVGSGASVLDHLRNRVFHLIETNGSIEDYRAVVCDTFVGMVDSAGIGLEQIYPPIFLWRAVSGEAAVASILQCMSKVKVSENYLSAHIVAFGTQENFADLIACESGEVSCMPARSATHAHDVASRVRSLLDVSQLLYYFAGCFEAWRGQRSLAEPSPAKSVFETILHNHVPLKAAFQYANSACKEYLDRLQQAISVDSPSFSSRLWHSLGMLPLIQTLVSKEFGAVLWSAVSERIIMVYRIAKNSIDRFSLFRVFDAFFLGLFARPDSTLSTLRKLYEEAEKSDIDVGVPISDFLQNISIKRQCQAELLLTLFANARIAFPTLQGDTAATVRSQPAFLPQNIEDVVFHDISPSTLYEEDDNTVHTPGHQGTPIRMVLPFLDLFCRPQGEVSALIAEVFRQCRPANSSFNDMLTVSTMESTVGHLSFGSYGERGGGGGGGGTAATPRRVAPDEAPQKSILKTPLSRRKLAKFLSRCEEYIGAGSLDPAKPYGHNQAKQVKILPIRESREMEVENMHASPVRSASPCPVGVSVFPASVSEDEAGDGDDGDDADDGSSAAHSMSPGFAVDYEALYRQAVQEKEHAEAALAASQRENAELTARLHLSINTLKRKHAERKERWQEERRGLEKRLRAALD